MNKNKSGFTIIELLVVVVIISILVAIGAVAVSGMRQRAYEAAVADELSQLRKEMEVEYIANGEWPFGTTMSSSSQLWCIV